MTELFIPQAGQKVRVVEFCAGRSYASVGDVVTVVSARRGDESAREWCALETEEWGFALCRVAPVSDQPKRAEVAWSPQVGEMCEGANVVNGSIVCGPFVSYSTSDSCYWSPHPSPSPAVATAILGAVHVRTDSLRLATPAAAPEAPPVAAKKPWSKQSCDCCGGIVVDTGKTLCRTCDAQHAEPVAAKKPDPYRAHTVRTCPHENTCLLAQVCRDCGASATLIRAVGQATNLLSWSDKQKARLAQARAEMDRPLTRGKWDWEPPEDFEVCK